MAIKKEHIKLTVPEGLQQVGEITVSGRTATFRVKGVTPGKKTISAKYRDGGTPVQTEVTVVDVPTAGNLTAVKNAVETGEKVKITQEFDKAPVIGDVDFELPAGVTLVAESKKLEGNNVVAEVMIETAGEKIVKSKYKTVLTGKQVTITGKDPVIQTMTADPASFNENTESTVTINFNPAE